MFLSPQWLLLLIPVAALAGVYVWLQLRRARFTARFSNVELLKSVAPRRPGWRRHLTFALLLAGMSVLSVGVARPSAEVKVPRERATVMMAIDVSLSMQATDVLPSRIDAAKQAAIDFAKSLPPQINLGLVSFGGNASVLVSPTLDRPTVTAAIKSLQLQESTAIGEAVFASLESIAVFDRSLKASGNEAPPARIVLLSDGASNRGRTPVQASAAATKAHVQVSTIAFGTDTGTVTMEGETIPVPADKPTLRLLATSTGGSYHSAPSAEALKQAYSDIGSQVGYTTEKRDISWRFLVVGVLFVLAAGSASMLWGGRLV